MKIGITVGIPFYNAEAYLADAIKCILLQDYKNIEILLVDDGSSDGSLNIAKYYESHFDNIKVISDGKNKGLPTRLNEIVYFAKHDYIARMDADDLITHDRLTHQIEFLINNPQYDLVSSSLISVDKNLNYLGSRGETDYNYTHEDILYRRKSFLHAGLLARKDWYLRNMYKESLKGAEDMELWLRSSKKNDFKAATLNNRLYIYREELNVSKEKLLRAQKIFRQHLVGFHENRINYFKYLTKSYLKSIFVTLCPDEMLKKFLLNGRTSELHKSDDIVILNNVINSVNSYNIKS